MSEEVRAQAITAAVAAAVAAAAGAVAAAAGRVKPNGGQGRRANASENSNEECAHVLEQLLVCCCKL
jgi:hypothetical protein